MSTRWIASLSATLLFVGLVVAEADARENRRRSVDESSRVLLASDSAHTPELSGRASKAYGMVNLEPLDAGYGTGSGTTGISAAPFGSYGTAQTPYFERGYGEGTGSLGVSGGKIALIGGGNSDSTAPEQRFEAKPDGGYGDGSRSASIAAGPSASYSRVELGPAPPPPRYSNTGVGGSGTGRLPPGRGSGSFGISAGRSGVYGGAFQSKIPRSVPAQQLGATETAEEITHGIYGVGVGSVGPAAVPRYQMPRGRDAGTE